ncbi:MAG: bifunctional DNA-formamidopyrimidine glycosylase/DNA-(apurinic or apyrimidinic site) lyase [Myxococcota bacterium]|nr:bifunctional DNA-formamidopyrimidine glycosylase/DNA-(apurinic or apyrimidinic site) lyase [Myxococcota bacterium]
MPELPEVEVTRRRIAPLLVDRRIEAVQTTPDSYFFLTPPDVLRDRVEDRIVRTLERRGKYLLAVLDDGCRLLIHLGMTGQLFSSEARSVRLLSATARSSLDPEEQEDFRADEHTHLAVNFADGGPQVYFRDVRKFGKVMLLEPGESHPRLDRLGPDALEADGESIFRASRKRKIPVKSLLLDQAVLAGVGNIYADEALFGAGVRPGRGAARLSRRECHDLATEIRRVLKRSIETGGSSISDYVSPDGRDGRFQDERRVYARRGEACVACGAAIRRKVIAQRSSHYCPVCQS